MVTVTIKGTDTIIAKSDNAVVVEGNQYFPPADVKTDLLSDSDTPYTCPWKGKAAYWNASVDGKQFGDLAWSYPNTKPAADHIKGFYAFDKGLVQFS